MANTPGPQAPIGNGQTINADAAPAFLAWRERVRQLTVSDDFPHGVTMQWTQGTRTYAEQYRLWDGYQKKLRGVKGYSSFNPAWHPNDNRANHMDGTAVDVGSGVGYLGTTVSKIAHATAAEFGIEFDVPGEGWHAHKTRPWHPPEATTPESQEDDMHIISSSKGQLLVDNGQPISLGTPDEVKALMRQGVKVYDVPDSLYSRYANKAWR